MGNGKESDKTQEKTEKAPEKGTEAETKVAAESQGEAVQVAKQQRLEGMSKFLNDGTMAGLANMKEGSKFELTGLDKSADKVPAAKESPVEVQEEAPEGKPEAKEEAADKPTEKDAGTGQESDLPSKITYKDGTTANVTYENGEAQKITFSNGKEMINNGDGSWTMSDKNTGKSDTYDVEVKVSPDGTITETAPDGASMEIGADNSRVIKDEEGRATSVTYPDDFSAEITRDSDGKPTQIDYSNGTKMSENEDGTWTLKDSDGNEIARYKDVNVSDNGQIAVTNDEGYTDRRSPDGVEDSIDPEGNVARKYPDNSQETYNTDLDRTSYTSPNGREYRETDQGLEYTVKPGDNPWTIAKDGLKAQGNPDPSNAEIAAELKRIEKATGKDMDETIYAGDTFVIPKPGESAPPESKTPETPEERQDEKAEGDAQERTDKITYPDGFSAEVTYNSEGQPEKIEYSNGTALAPNEYGSWDLTDANGDTIATYKDVSVASDGTISVTNDDGYVSSRGPDGTETVSRKVSYPDGFSANVTYNKDGQPERIDYSNNTSLARTEDGKYELKDANGDVIATYKDVAVSPDGAISVTDDNGSVSTRRADGSEVTTDAQQRPDRITYPDGFSADPKYGPDGQLQEIEYSNDTKLTKNENGTWDLKDANGDTIATYKDVSVSPDGAISTTNDNGSVATRYPNGNEVTASDTETTVKSPDGSTMTYKHTPDGHVTEITSSSEPPIKYDAATGTYIFYDSEGNPITEGALAPEKSKVTIDNKGVLTHEREDKSKTISSPGGTTREETPEAAVAGG